MFLKAVEQKAVEKDAQELHDDSDRQQQAAGLHNRYVKLNQA
jgi:hypothetical protein